MRDVFHSIWSSKKWSLQTYLHLKIRICTNHLQIIFRSSLKNHKDCQMSPLFLILIITGFLSVNSFSTRPLLPLLHALRGKSNVRVGRNEMLDHYMRVKVDEHQRQVYDDLNLKTRQSFDQKLKIKDQTVQPRSTQDIVQQGGRLMAYSTRPTLSNQIALTDASVNTLTLMHPLILMTTLIDIVIFTIICLFD